MGEWILSYSDFIQKGRLSFLAQITGNMMSDNQPESYVEDKENGENFLLPSRLYASKWTQFPFGWKGNGERAIYRLSTAGIGYLKLSYPFSLKSQPEFGAKNFFHEASDSGKVAAGELHVLMVTAVCPERLRRSLSQGMQHLAMTEVHHIIVYTLQFSHIINGTLKLLEQESSSTLFEAKGRRQGGRSFNKKIL